MKTKEKLTISLILFMAMLLMPTKVQLLPIIPVTLAYIGILLMTFSMKGYKNVEKLFH
jgi:hypothetical protein